MIAGLIIIVVTQLVALVGMWWGFGQTGLVIMIGAETMGALLLLILAYVVERQQRRRERGVARKS